jgi:L-seryl-tRNA(Ser) seleniumtransferase
MQELFKAIPQVSAILENPEFASKYGHLRQEFVTNLLRDALESVRTQIKDGKIKDISDVEKTVSKAVYSKLKVLVKSSLVRVVNGTGIVLHTNLGRAPMMPNPRLTDILEGYCNLEYDLKEGVRGKRGVHVRSVLQVMTGSESVVVVNNNAAALLLLLKTHADGREVIVSRGELIELGGSFRLPEVMQASGAILREVGTTNRTHLKDYAGVINEKTAMILKVHPSNYAIRGFTTCPTNSELSELAKSKGIIYCNDIGSGLIRRIDHPKFKDEPCLSEALADGADAVLFSGDKLLGGTQAGFIVGSEKVAGACGKLPMMRSLRLAKAHMCMLEETLRIWLLPDQEVIKRNPVLRMISRTDEELKLHAEKLSKMVNDSIPKAKPEVVPLVGQMGGGTLPDVDFNSFGIKLSWKGAAQDLLSKLRSFSTPVIARIEDDSVVIDVRCILPGEDEIVSKAINSAYAN